MARLQRRLWEGLRERVPYLKLNGPELGPRRIGNNLNLSAEFVEGESLALLCDTQGIAVASGPGCVSKSLRISHVLQALGLEHGLAQASVMLSLGRGNTDEEIDYVLDTFPRLVEKLRGMSPRWADFAAGLADSALAPRGPAGSMPESAPTAVSPAIAARRDPAAELAGADGLVRR